MEDTVLLDSLQERLQRAMMHFGLVPPQPLPGGRKQLVETVRSRVVGAPAFQDLQSWAEIHWGMNRELSLPPGTVQSSPPLQQFVETQIDGSTAACKLLLAAVEHGVEAVSRHALEFSKHGAVESYQVFFLRGLSITSARPLDDYCTLLPYGEALRKVQPDDHPVAEFRINWPPEDTANICALGVRYFERYIPNF